jgi:hypothetical protein
LHPWELDPEQPRVQASWFSKFRHYNNLDKCQGRLETLLTDFKFTTMSEVLTNLGLLAGSGEGQKKTEHLYVRDL